MARLYLPVLALALLLLAACGGNGEPEPTTAETPTATAPPATGTAAPSGSPTPTVPTTPTEAPATATPTPVPTAPPTGFTYIVQPGDTLYSIAHRFGTTVQAIAAANNITDPSRITVGQALIIPGAVITPSPTPFSGVAQVVRKGDPTRRRVAFSFDAGSDAGYTDQILDTLRANGIVATFGITGRWAEQNAALVRRIVDDGHGLINHSYDHSSFTGLSTGRPPLTREQRWEQLDRTEGIIQQLTGATTKPHFRPPFGDYDQSVNEDVGARGYRYNVMWTVDSRGWTGIPAAEIRQRCLGLAEPGAIYVFHVGAASQDGPALQSIIDGLRADGYEIGAVADVIQP